MVEIREKLVSLWARVINREIVQTNFWFLKNSSWIDIDVIGIEPSTNVISLYNVKSNINTNTISHKPEAIATNFSNTIEAINNGFNNDFLFKVYFIFESADLFKKRNKDIKSTEEWLKAIEIQREDYRKELEKELKDKNIGQIKTVELKSIHECIKEIINETKIPTTTGGHCFKFENQYFYPYHKISEFKILDIFTDYNIKD